MTDGTIWSDDDRRWMERALTIARLGEGRTAPNPPVGAVLVNTGKIVGEGFHAKAGEPHAEIFALRQAGDRARGAVAYVTLEPCAHHGRTPPCTEALIRAGVARVVIGCEDPNPRVQGGGAHLLEAAGIDVQSGLCKIECRRLIAPFAHHVSTGRPFTTLKAAVTLDGKTATSTGQSQWISSEPARQEAHRLRNSVDAIMVGIDTAIEDDPKLTTRGIEDGRDPLRVVVDSTLRLPLESAILHVASPSPTLIATTGKAPQARIDAARATGAEVVVFEGDDDSRVDLEALWKALGEREVQHLLVEGGATLNQAVLESGLAQRMMVILCPLMLGGDDAPGIFRGRGVGKLNDAVRLTGLRARPCGPDVIIEGEVEPCSLD
ncbi:MAG: bifunctional diaminohydroxyphosphoribosylaminopyrimidine deaminase/5-amino-6-(5-phosphoribosylamino)uracil reductase RibD [Acidobacteriota bacterium]